MEPAIRESVKDVLSGEMGDFMGRAVEKVAREYAVEPFQSLLDDYLTKK